MEQSPSCPAPQDHFSSSLCSSEPDHWAPLPARAAVPRLHQTNCWSWLWINWSLSLRERHQAREGWFRSPGSTWKSPFCFCFVFSPLSEATDCSQGWQGSFLTVWIEVKIRGGKKKPTSAKRRSSTEDFFSLPKHLSTTCLQLLTIVLARISQSAEQ